MRNTCLDHPSLSIIHAVSFFYTEIPPPKTKFIFSPPTECKLHESKDFVLFISVLGECVISSVLSHHSKDVKGGTVLHLCYSSVLFGKQRIVYPRDVRAIQFSSVAQSCPTLCDPMNRSTPGLPVHHQLLEFTETHVHRVSDAIQPTHPLLSPSPPAPNPSQHQSLFQ